MRRLLKSPLGFPEERFYLHNNQWRSSYRIAVLLFKRRSKASNPKLRITVLYRQHFITITEFILQWNHLINNFGHLIQLPFSICISEINLDLFFFLFAFLTLKSLDQYYCLTNSIKYHHHLISAYLIVDIYIYLHNSHINYSR